MDNFFDQIAEQFQLPLQSPVLIFSLILFIILLAPILLKKIRVPGIIGLIIAGIIIGPEGFNVLESSKIEIFSTIGLLYIMFIAGLELDMNQFKAHRNKSLVFGFFTFAIPMAIGYPVYYYILGQWDEEINKEAAFLTASMFATHTLVTYPIVSKLGLAKNVATSITVGATILTDTAVLILLAVILGSHSGGLSQEFWIQLAIGIVLFSAFMFLVIPRITKWFFRKFSSEKHSHYVFVLAVVFLAAFLSEIAGLEAIIGAFFAGLALNKLIPNSSALMQRIDFIGNSLFIPFFFISVGMIVDVSVIFNGWMAVIIAATLTIVALIGKWLAAWVTQLVYKFSTGQRNLIFGLSSAHAAATLAIIIVGHEAGIIDDNILNGTVILILITCIIASLVTEKAAKKVIQETEEDLDLEPAVKNEFILMPIANTVNIEKMLDFAVYVKDKNSENPLSILSVVDNNDEAERKIIKTKESLEKIVQENTGEETDVDVRATIDHNAASGIARTAKELNADLIFLGWPERVGFIDKIIGDKMGSIISMTEKTLFICDFKAPLIDHKRLFLVVPPNAEFEEGFVIWMEKLAQLATELSLPIQLSTTEITYKSIKKYIKQNKLSLTIDFHNFNDWEDFFVLSKHIEDRDILIVVGARKGTISHVWHIDRLPGKMERHFTELSKIVIYPQ